MKAKAWHAAVNGDMEWFAQNNRLWRQFGEAIISGDERAIERSRNELEAHVGGEWMPSGSHGTYHEEGL